MPPGEIEIRLRIRSYSQYQVLFAQIRAKHVIGQTLIKKAGREDRLHYNSACDWCIFVTKYYVLAKRCPGLISFLPNSSYKQCKHVRPPWLCMEMEMQT